MCRVAILWCLAAALLVALARAQQVISVTTGATCVSIPRNGQQFSCDANPARFKTTVMNVLVNPNSAGSNAVTFNINLTSLPQFGGTQEGTADTCTDPDILGLCSASSNATVTFSATPATLIYNLTPLYQNVPFAYLSQTITAPTAADTLIVEGDGPGMAPSTMLLQNIQVQTGLVQNINNFADVKFRSSAWYGPDAYKYYRCGPSTYRSGDVYPYPVMGMAPDSTVQRPFPPTCVNSNTPSLDTPGATMGYATATWQMQPCPKNVNTNCCPDNVSKTRCIAKTTSAAVDVGPVCSVFRVNPRATLSTKLTVTLTTKTQTRVLTLPNVGVGATQSTPEGDFLVSIQDLPTTDGFYGPHLPGYVIICGATPEAIQNFTMVPPGDDPGLNPWANFADSSNLLFTPENVAFARGSITPDLYNFPYFVDSVTGQAIGQRCTQLGVTRNFANQVGFSNLLANAAGAFGKTTSNDQRLAIPYTEIVRTLQNGMTCAPQFSNTFLSLPLVTPCQAEVQMYRGNRNASFTPNGVLPPFFNRAKPNIWFTPGQMRVELPNTIQVRAVAAFNGNLVDVRGKVSYGTFDVAGCACIVDSNPGAKNSSLYFHVCNKSSFESSYIISSTCVAGLTPASGGSVTTQPIAPESCALTELALTVGVVPKGAKCSATLLPLNAELAINNVKTSTIELTCVVTSSFVPPAVQKPSDVVNFDIWAVPTPIPDKMVESSETEYDLVSILIYSIAGLFVALFLGLVVGLIVVTIKTNKDREKVKRLMQSAY